MRTGMISLLAAAAFAGTASAQLYVNNDETASRYSPGAGAGTTPRITFDDVQIPLDRLAGATGINVTSVTFGIRRSATANASDLSLYYATTDGASLGPAVPSITQFGTFSLEPLDNAGFTTEIFTIGNGVDTLFTVDLDFNDYDAGTTDYDNAGTFFIGLQFGEVNPTGTPNGWRITQGPDVNDDNFWVYDPTDDAVSFLVFSSGLAGEFYLVVEGTPIPAPGGAALLAAGGLLAVRRRR